MEARPKVSKSLKQEHKKGRRNMLNLYFSFVTFHFSLSVDHMQKW